MSKNEHFIKGMDKVNENDFESAIELFGKALASDMNKEEVYYNRAVAYLNLNQTCWILRVHCCGLWRANMITEPMSPPEASN